VRAVAASASPLICGVGHETDFTLSDFAADLRAPTPTAAAELSTPITVGEFRERVVSASIQMQRLTLVALSARREDTAAAANALRYYSPARRIQSDRQRLDDYGRRVLAADAHLVTLYISQLEGWHHRLLALSPQEVLNRGYAIVTRQDDGALIREVKQASGGIRVRVSDGSFDADVSRSRA
jgi:exodeoxyribonuclease VII large subunit